MLERGQITEPFRIETVELEVRTLYETRTLAFRTRPSEVTVDLYEDPNPWERSSSSTHTTPGQAQRYELGTTSSTRART